MRTIRAALAAIMLAIGVAGVSTLAHATTDPVTSVAVRIDCATMSVRYEVPADLTGQNFWAEIMVAASPASTLEYLYEVPLGDAVTAGFEVYAERPYVEAWALNLDSLVEGAHVTADCSSSIPAPVVDVPAAPAVEDNPAVQGDAHYVLPTDDSTFAWVLNPDGTATVVIIAENTTFADGTTSYLYPAPVDVYEAAPAKGKPIKIDLCKVDPAAHGPDTRAVKEGQEVKWLDRGYALCA